LLFEVFCFGKICFVFKNKEQELTYKFWQKNIKKLGDSFIKDLIENWNEYMKIEPFKNKKTMKSKIMASSCGTKHWYDENGLLHREDGPAVEYSNGSKVWYKNGRLHREDGPAIEWADGKKEWWVYGKRYTEEDIEKLPGIFEKIKNQIKNTNPMKQKMIVDHDGTKRWYNEKNQLHREDGPAIEGSDGTKYWYKNGKLHREDGPAIEYADGKKEWWVYGEQYTEEGVEKMEKVFPILKNIFNFTKSWYNAKQQLHREEGPALECLNRYKMWYINGKLHREDGPAVEFSDGTKKWYFKDKLHREDGPAIEWSDGTKEWWFHGTKYTEEDLEATEKKLTFLKKLFNK
jgi:hypothetical protein